ncbi:MAG: hypothetical protein KDC84_16205, partial [Crocinitomicaceae bacterium]|nr:hypothetical protein [Crocinitomicaceae bacterium]
MAKKKTILMEEAFFHKLRDAVIDKLKSHPKAAHLEKANQEGYGAFIDDIKAEVLKVIEHPDNVRDKEIIKLKARLDQITKYKLWKFLYESRVHPEKRGAMRKSFIKLLMLFAYEEIRENDLAKELRNSPNILSRQRQGLTNLFGFEVFGKLTVARIQRAIEDAKFEIRILDTFFNNWGRLQNPLKEAVERGCKVKILLSDPELSPIIERSERILWFSEPGNLLTQSIDKIRKITQSWENAHLVEVETHRNLPGFNLFAIDRDYFVGLFWFNHEAVEGPFMKVSDNEEFKDLIDEHFNGIWEDAKSRQKATSIGTNKKIDSRLEALEGNWLLYCNQGEKGKQTFRLRSMEHGKVVENLLQLKVVDHKLEATFTSNNRREFRGEAHVCQENHSYFEIKMKSGGSIDTLYFIFYLGEDHLIGIYNLMYERQPFFGTGLAAMIRFSRKKALMNPREWNPSDVGKEENEKNKKLLRYLAFPLGTRIEVIQDIENLKKITRFNLPFQFRGI